MSKTSPAMAKSISDWTISSKPPSVERKPSFVGKAFRFASPLLDKLGGDRAYHLTRLALRTIPSTFYPTQTPDPSLQTKAFGLNFVSPLGIGAGFDKDGKIAKALWGFGASFIELGTITPRAQKGNPKPTIKTFPKEQTCINGMGFPNRGLDKLLRHLEKSNHPHPIGVNIGANRDSADKIKDYTLCVERLNQAKTKPDYITLNVSSPNTPNLRQLEALDQLATLLDAIKTPIPLLLKVSPDLPDEAYGDIATLALEKNLAGVIATNTTINHPHKDSVYGGGGLSGAPLRERAEHITHLLYQKLQGRLPIIGVGGIDSGQAAYRRIRAGATLLQVWTGLIWGGPDLIRFINADLAFLLKKDGFQSIGEAVGTKTKEEK